MKKRVTLHGTEAQDTLPFYLFFYFIIGFKDRSNVYRLRQLV